MKMPIDKEDVVIMAALLIAGYGIYTMFSLGPALVFCGSYVLLVSLIGLLKR